MATIETEIAAAIMDPDITTASLTFPSVRQVNELVGLIQEVSSGSKIFLQQDIVFEGFRCFGLRVRVGESLSWVSGFGPFDFLPATRRSPHTEIVFRAKQRPNYDWILKPSPDAVIHLADMNMHGLSESTLRRMWTASFSETEQILGGKPDIKSAAKTTFAIPKNLVAEQEE